MTQIKKRNWTLTIYDFNELNGFEDDRVKYGGYGDETCPTTKREHKQGFISFKMPQRFSLLKSLFPTAHIEVMKGKIEDNITYCSKDESFHEFGTRPMTQKEKGEEGKEYWDKQIELAKQDPMELELHLDVSIEH